MNDGDQPPSDDRFINRVTLDLGGLDGDFLLRVASYRTERAKALAPPKARGKKPKPPDRVSRKSLCEAMVASQTMSLRKDMDDVIRNVGPLPDHRDKKEMAAYALRAVAWEAKRGK